MSTSPGLAPAGSSSYASNSMTVGDGTWDATSNTFLLPNLVGLNFETMRYNGMGNRFREQPGYYNLILAHGVIAAITFLFIVPAAILTVRFNSHVSAVRIHVSLQIITVLLSTVVIALSFNAVGPSRRLSNPHHGIGLAIYILVLFQFFLGWWMHRKERNRRDRPYEPLKVTLHHWLGRFIALLGLAQVPLGLTLYGSPKYLFGLYAAVVFILFAIYFQQSRLYERRRYDDFGSRYEYGTGSVLPVRERRSSGPLRLFEGAIAGIGLYALVNKFRRRPRTTEDLRVSGDGPEVIGSRRHSVSHIQSEKLSDYSGDSRVGRWEDRLFRIAAPLGAGALVTRYFDKRYGYDDGESSDHRPPVAGHHPIHDSRLPAPMPLGAAPPGGAMPVGAPYGTQTTQYGPTAYGPGGYGPSMQAPTGHGPSPYGPNVYGPGVGPSVAANAVPPLDRHRHHSTHLPGSRASSDSQTGSYTASLEPRRSHKMRDGLATLGVLGLAKSIFNRRRDRREDERYDETHDSGYQNNDQPSSTLPHHSNQPGQPSTYPPSAFSHHHPDHADQIPPIPAGVYSNTAMAGGLAAGGLAAAEADRQRERERRRQEALPLGGVNRPVSMPQIPADPQGLFHPESSVSDSSASQDERTNRRRHESRIPPTTGLGSAATGYAAGNTAATSHQRQERHQSTSAGEGSIASPPVSVRVKMHKDGRHVTLSRLPGAQADARRRNRSDSTSSVSTDGPPARYRRRNMEDEQAMSAARADLAAARTQAQNPSTPTNFPGPPPIPTSTSNSRPLGAGSVGSPATYDGMTTDASADYANNRRRRRAERAREKEAERQRREARPTKTVGFEE